MLDVCDFVDEGQVYDVLKGFNNFILWNVGYIILDQDMWFYYFIVDDLEVFVDYVKFFGYGISLVMWDVVFLFWIELMECLRV